MKLNNFYVVFLVSLFLISLEAAGKDLIHLHNGEIVKGYIIDLRQDEVTISKKQNNYKEIQTFSAEEVKLVEFDARNVNIIKLINKEITQQRNMCNEGYRDAELYHKRFVGNFALGFFFNIFGFAGVAITNPKSPDPLMINDAEKLNNTEFLLCYEKKAKKKNIKAAGIGWITIVVLVLLGTR
ncbi:hypothetical protein ACFLU5_12815 [Bacteroidota bacterium]